MLRQGSCIADQFELKHAFGHTVTGGEVWLGHCIMTGQPVIIRQSLLSARSSASTELQTRAAVLLHLQHSRVPRYLYADFLAEDEGSPNNRPCTFYTVQELVKAKPLVQLSISEPVSLKAIASQTLGILQDLRQKSSRYDWYHGEISPLALWLDDQQQVYLMNFGLGDFLGSLGRAGGPAIATHLSYFLAPEQRHRNTHNTSTDLYSLGLTLIAHITQTPVDRIQSLFDREGCIRFQNRVPARFSIEFIRWLDTLVQSDYPDRFVDATAALQALEPLSSERHPELHLTPRALSLKAKQLNEVLFQRIQISNSVPDTTLEGYWTVNLPQHQATWLRIEPQRIQSNQVQCRLAIDTGALKSNQSKQLELCFHSNASRPEIRIPIQVQTARFQPRWLPFGSLLLLVGLALGAGYGATPLVNEFGNLGWTFFGAGFLLSGYMGWAIARSNWDVLFRASLMTGSIGMAVGALAGNPRIFDAGLMNYILGGAIGAPLVGIATACARRHKTRQFTDSVAVLLPALALVLAFGWGVRLSLATVLPLFQLALHGLSGIGLMLIGSVLLHEFLRLSNHRAAQRQRV